MDGISLDTSLFHSYLQGTWIIKGTPKILKKEGTCALHAFGNKVSITFGINTITIFNPQGEMLSALSYSPLIQRNDLRIDDAIGLNSIVVLTIFSSTVSPEKYIALFKNNQTELLLTLFKHNGVTKITQLLAIKLKRKG